nr:mRNA-decapping enzyme 1B [Onthophagus taurus]
MADSVELRMSVTSIKRVDPYVKDILATSTHVALYKFNPLANEWEKTETEGALFLYSRNGEPYHSLVIMNRLNTENLIEPIVKEFDYQMQAPFLLYRNSMNKIFGIWFYNREECVTITYILESLMEQIREKVLEKTKKKSGSSVDIFSMLSKAQEDFNRTPNKRESPVNKPMCTSTPLANTSQSVMDFFSKAASKSSKQVPVTPAEGEILLQRLMSNPEHSVEHIEKQQRSTTPQEHRHQKQLGNRSVPIQMSSNSTNLDRKSENGLNFMRGVSSPHNHPAASGTSPLAALLIQAQAQAVDDDLLGTSPLAHALDTPQKPSLMPPMMFTASVNKDNKSDMVLTPTTSVDNAKVVKAVEPLTRNQMLQALTYLIKNDSDFVTKLHEAYVKSLTEMVANNTNSLI